jgi:hypothetical protein
MEPEKAIEPKMTVAAATAYLALLDIMGDSRTQQEILDTLVNTGDITPVHKEML